MMALSYASETTLDSAPAARHADMAIGPHAVRRLAGLWPPLTLAGLLALAMAPTLLAGRALAIGDGMAQDFPLRLLATRAWQSGVVPFWDPFGFGGTPLLAAIHVGVLFPGNLPFLLVGPVAAMNATVMLALWLGGYGAYRLARAQALPRGASTVAGLVFMASGFLVEHVQNLQMLQAASLMPWVLWSLARHAGASDGRYGPVFAIALALQILAGHPQMVVFTGLVTVAYAGYLAVRREAGTRLGFLVGFAAAGVLGLLLAAPQLLPTLDFIPGTQRSAIDFDELTFRSLPFRQLISFWFPYLFGGYGTPMVPTYYWGAPHQTELCGYVGLVALVVGLGGLVGARRTSPAWFWLAVAVCGVLLALGDNTALYWIWAKLPLLKSLPAPGRHLLEADLALAMLAGFGFEALGDAARRKGFWACWAALGLPVLAVVAMVALQGPSIEVRLQPFMPEWVSLAGFFSLASPTFWVPLALWAALAPCLWAAGRPVARWGVVALLLADLGFFVLNQGWSIRGVLPPAPLVAAAPKMAAGEARTWPISSKYVYPYDDFATTRALRYPNWGGLVDVRAINGYDAFIPSRYARVMAHMESTGFPVVPGLLNPTNHALELLGVHTIVVDRYIANDPHVIAELARKGYREDAARPLVKVFRTRRYMPRAWRLDATASLPPAMVEEHVMRDAAFDPANLGYLDAPDAAAGRWAPGTASARTPNFNTIVVDTNGRGPGFVAVNERFDPNWRAALVEAAGERPLAVHAVDALLMGIEVPEGHAQVVLSYEPRTWRLGLGLGGAALLLVLGWWGAIALATRSRKAAGAPTIRV